LAQLPIFLERLLRLTVVEILMLLFAVSLAAWAVYVLVRPFTRIHYQHPSERLWKPLD